MGKVRVLFEPMSIYVRNMLLLVAGVLSGRFITYGKINRIERMSHGLFYLSQVREIKEGSLINQVYVSTFGKIPCLVRLQAENL